MRREEICQGLFLIMIIIIIKSCRKRAPRQPQLSGEKNLKKKRKRTCAGSDHRPRYVPSDDT
jgi:hypothetical protein